MLGAQHNTFGASLDPPSAAAFGKEVHWKAKARRVVFNLRLSASAHSFFDQLVLVGTWISPVLNFSFPFNCCQNRAPTALSWWFHVFYIMYTSERFPQWLNIFQLLPFLALSTMLRLFRRKMAGKWPENGPATSPSEPCRW